MRVYRPHGTGRRDVLIVAPGAQYPNADWLEADGRPRQFAIEFKGGSAVVDDELGRYLIDHGYAQASPILLPEAVS